MRSWRKGAWFKLLLAAAWMIAVPVYAQSQAPVEPVSKPADEAPQAPAVEPKADAAALATPADTAETRKAQIEAQTKELYRLSAELREEVGKTYKDTLSLAVLKKAEQIEKLAKSLRALMNAEAADSKEN
jgi:hypothetical protein